MTKYYLELATEEDAEAVRAWQDRFDGAAWNIAASIVARAKLVEQPGAIALGGEALRAVRAWQAACGEDGSIPDITHHKSRRMHDALADAPVLDPADVLPLLRAALYQAKVCEGDWAPNDYRDATLETEEAARKLSSEWRP